MAVRSPTSFSDLNQDIAPRKPILAADFDELVDDQHLVLLKDEMVSGDCFAVEQFTPSGTWATARSYVVRAPHRCGYAATQACKAAVLARKTSGSVDFDVGIYIDATTRYSLTVSSSHTTWLWRGYFDVTLKADGTIQGFDVQGNSASGTLQIGGFAIFTEI